MKCLYQVDCHESPFLPLFLMHKMFNSYLVLVDRTGLHLISLTCQN